MIKRLPALPSLSAMSCLSTLYAVSRFILGAPAEEADMGSTTTGITAYCLNRSNQLTNRKDTSGASSTAMHPSFSLSHHGLPNSDAVTSSYA